MTLLEQPSVPLCPRHNNHVIVFVCSRQISVLGNQLSGQLPQSIGNLDGLTCVSHLSTLLLLCLQFCDSTALSPFRSYLGLDGNQFTGTLPCTFGQLSAHCYITLSGNHFSSTAIPGACYYPTNYTPIIAGATVGGIAVCVCVYLWVRHRRRLAEARRVRVPPLPWDGLPGYDSSPPSHIRYTFTTNLDSVQVDSARTGTRSVPTPLRIDLRYDRPLS